MPSIMLETERLTLREFQDGDVGPLHLIHTDREIMEFSGGENRFASPEATHEYMRMRNDQRDQIGYSKWAIEERSSGCLIGRSGMAPVDGFIEPELGWVLARDKWGYGYATEAALACIRFGFDELNVDRIISLITPGNERSIAVAKRAGERFEGEVVSPAGPALLYAIHRSPAHSEIIA